MSRRGGERERNMTTILASLRGLARNPCPAPNSRKFYNLDLHHPTHSRTPTIRSQNQNNGAIVSNPVHSPSFPLYAFLPHHCSLLPIPKTNNNSPLSPTDAQVSLCIPRERERPTTLTPNAARRPIAPPSRLSSMATTEPFPPLNTANDHFSTSQDANGNAARRRRKSSGIQAESRTDTGPSSLATSFAHLNAASGRVSPASFLFYFLHLIRS